jgi:hypothetical protein
MSNFNNILRILAVYIDWNTILFPDLHEISHLYSQLQIKKNVFNKININGIYSVYVLRNISHFQKFDKISYYVT